MKTRICYKFVKSYQTLWIIPVSWMYLQTSKLTYTNHQTWNYYVPVGIPIFVRQRSSRLLRVPNYFSRTSSFQFGVFILHFYFRSPAKPTRTMTPAVWKFTRLTARNVGPWRSGPCRLTLISGASRSNRTSWKFAMANLTPLIWTTRSWILCSVILSGKVSLYESYLTFLLASYGRTDLPLLPYCR